MMSLMRDEETQSEDRGGKEYGSKDVVKASRRRFFGYSDPVLSRIETGAFPSRMKGAEFQT